MERSLVNLQGLSWNICEEEEKSNSKILLRCAALFSLQHSIVGKNLQQYSTHESPFLLFTNFSEIDRKMEIKRNFNEFRKNSDGNRNIIF